MEDKLYQYLVNTANCKALDRYSIYRQDGIVHYNVQFTNNDDKKDFAVISENVLTNFK